MYKIPKIIHQTWEDENIPKPMLNYVKSWKDKNPDYSFMFWTAEQRRNLIRDHYPWFLKYFDSYPHQIMRVDAFKLFVLHRYGGFYADLDLECYKCLDPLLKESNLLLFLESPGSASNAAMGSSPNHPFLEYCFEGLIDSHVSQGPKTIVWKVTGPKFLTQHLYNYKSLGYTDYKLYPSHYFFPIPWHRPKDDQSGQEKKYPRSFGAHHWQGTWWQQQPGSNSLWLYCGILAFLVLCIVIMLIYYILTK